MVVSEPPGSGVVFNAATTDWARLLFYGDSAVEAITKNVLARCAGVTISIKGPLPPTCDVYYVFVAGQTVSFESDVEPPDAYKYSWVVSGGIPSRTDQPTVQISTSVNPQPLVVTLTVSLGGVIVGTATATSVPVDSAFLLMLRFMCPVRKVLALAPKNALPIPLVPPVRGPGPDPGPIDFLFSNLWDPVRDGLTGMGHPGSETFAALRSALQLATSRLLEWEIGSRLGRQSSSGAAARQSGLGPAGTTISSSRGTTAGAGAAATLRVKTTHVDQRAVADLAKDAATGAVEPEVLNGSYYTKPSVPTKLTP